MKNICVFDFLKKKHLYHKRTTDNMKNQSTDLKKLLAADKYDKRLISTIYKVILSNDKEKKTQLINEKKS